MTEVVSPNPRSQYLRAVDADPRSRRWFDFNTLALDHLLRDGEKAMGKLLKYAINASSGLPLNTELPDVQWIKNDPTVMALTGGEFTVPVMEFGADRMDDFRKICGPATFGITVQIPAEIISVGEIRNKDMRPMSLVVLPTRDVTFESESYEYDSVRAHEFIHAVDPGADYRPVFMTEVNAIIGSYSSPEKRLAMVNQEPYVLIHYIIQELIHKQVPIEQVSETQVIRDAYAGSKLLFNATHQFPRVPNDEIARELMRFTSMEDLKREHPEFFLEGYEPELDLNLVRAMIQMEYENLI